MGDEEASRRSPEVRDEISMGEPRLELLRRARRLANRRRRASACVAIGVVSVVVAAGVAVVVQRAGHSANAPAQSAAASNRNRPGVGLMAPPGTRFVGTSGVGVAVPVSWGTHQALCQAPMVDAVIVSSYRRDACNTLPPNVSSVHFHAYGSAYSRQFISGSVPAGDVGGIPVSRFSTQPIPCGHAPCHMYEGALLFESRDLTIWVDSPSRATVDTVLGSAFAVPPGYVSIPAAPSREELQRLGLTVRIRHRYAPRLFDGILFGSNPPIGGLVAQGSAVTLIFGTWTA